MSTPPRTTSGNQSDMLLWVAGGAVAAVGAAWLAIMKPWAGPDAEQVVAAPVVMAMAEMKAPAANVPGGAVANVETMLDNPLRMAELAYDAGMLVEPEEYSAWTLYSRVVKTEPANATALAGLAKVADDLTRRGETALDQGRFDDARATVERIRAVLPEHAGATALAAKIWPKASAPEPTLELAPELPAPTVPVTPVTVAAEEQEPPPPAIDPIVEASASFEGAMAAGRLLTPADESAKHFVAVMTALNAGHDRTKDAQRILSNELLTRAAQALESLDTEAAGIWIDEADTLGVDATGVRNARLALTEQLVSMESAKPVPASALKLVTYVAPIYPDRAFERRLEGWVDVEFTVGTDGVTRDVAIAAASHENYFRREAIEAVAQWRFEPRIFMNRAIEQRSYTRIRFVE